MVLISRSSYVATTSYPYRLTGKYQYTADLLALDRCRAPQPRHILPLMASIVTPLPWREWQMRLATHPDRNFANLVVTGIKEGFRVRYDYSSHTCKKSPKNMQSAREGRAVINEYLAQECAEGRTLGSFDKQSLPQLQVSRLGVVPKHTPGLWHLIVDLSSPDGHSVNDGISRSLCSLTYVSVDTAVNLVEQLGRGTLLAKVDIRSAYRMLPIHPDDRWLLGNPIWAPVSPKYIYG